MPRTLLTLPRGTTSDATALRAGFAAVRAELGVPVDFDAGALADATAAAGAGAGVADAATPGAEPAGADADRRDDRDIPYVTLDPTGSTDLDQAVHLSRRGAGYRVRYAIADVAAVVSPGGALDLATHRRGTTVYCPDTRVPLHPPVLSEGAASLLPGVDRRAITWTLDLDTDGVLVGVDVRRSVIRSRAQLDYAGVQHDVDALARGDGDSFAALLARIGSLRARQERDRGGVSLGRPEQTVVAVGDGWTLAFRAPLAVEDHNAQISLLTGMAAARLMIDGGIGILRTLPPAGAEALAHLRRQAGALGIAWPETLSYGDLLRGLDRSAPTSAAFLSAATSLFRGAAWTPFDGTAPVSAEHAAVGAPYAHVTAPLRRLVDRFGLEVCVALHAGRPVPDWVRRALPSLGEEMAVAARRAAAVDRACTDLVEATVLGPRVGEVFDVVALGRETVQLTEPAVLARYTGPDLAEGQPARVRLVRADVPSRQVLFGPTP